ncbi:MAG: hypothetical protein M1371_04100 [Actinobacteria bacterium]|nr:hypothetical protein [Actinomycetota bacterium]
MKDESLFADIDLKNKLAYLLGIFGDKRAESTLISMVDTKKEEIVDSAIMALARINSLKSLRLLIFLYKNYNLEYTTRSRIIDAINILKDKNPSVLPDNILDIFEGY